MKRIVGGNNFGRWGKTVAVCLLVGCLPRVEKKQKGGASIRSPEEGETHSDSTFGSGREETEEITDSTQSVEVDNATHVAESDRDGSLDEAAAPPNSNVSAVVDSSGFEPLPMAPESTPHHCDGGNLGPSGDWVPIAVTTNHLVGSLIGLAPNQVATVSLGDVADAYLQEAEIQGSQAYEFSAIPNGCYYLSFRTPGARAPVARLIDVHLPESAPPDYGVLPNGLRVQTFQATETAQRLDVTLDTWFEDTAHSEYHWAADVSRAGYEVSVMPRSPAVLGGVGDPLIRADLQAADNLAQRYNVQLIAAQGLFDIGRFDSDGVAVSSAHEVRNWTAELAHRLLQTMRTIPQPVRTAGVSQLLERSTWWLTNERLSQDIEVVFNDEGDHKVLISAKAFVHAAPREARLDGNKGSFFSQRLYHALLRFVTRQGTSEQAVERIFNEKHGVTLRVSQLNASAGEPTVCPDYAGLTVTQEWCSSFQLFRPEEKLEMLSRLALLPLGLQSNDNLQTLIRRKNGAPHPGYPTASAVAWCDANRGYIEFMESTFTGDPESMHRLVLHEMAHCVFSTLSVAMRERWAEVGGWVQDSNGEYTVTSQTVQFVSAYAHARNYNEDFAESVAFFVLNPTALETRAPDKFEFLRDFVMSGTRYLTTIDEQFTFEVLNLWPDYTYPGKINGLDITIDGEAEEDKLVEITVHLDESNAEQGGASIGNVRIHSSEGTHEETWLEPLNGDSSTLRGSLVISRFAPAGCWYTNQIALWDQAGNRRLEGRRDFGWRLCVDNPLADSEPPRFVEGSASIRVAPSVANDADGVEHEVRLVTLEYQINEITRMDPSCVYASLRNADGATRSIESWGQFDETSETAIIEFTLTEYAAGGTWGVPYVYFCDAAGLSTHQYFGGEGEPAEVGVSIAAVEPDTAAPLLALTSGSDSFGNYVAPHVTSAPTNPEAPDGETLVTLEYYARDNKSGVGTVSYRFLDPLGTSHFGYHYHENLRSLYFAGEASEWRRYELNVLLPAGSTPGVWGVQELVVCDKVGNCYEGNFTETLIFTPEGPSSASL